MDEQQPRVDIPIQMATLLAGENEGPVDDYRIPIPVGQEPTPFINVPVLAKYKRAGIDSETGELYYEFDSFEHNLK